MTLKPISGSIVIFFPKSLHQRFTRQRIAPIDAHRVGAANAVGAGAPIGQRAVLMPLDLVEPIEHAILVRGHPILERRTSTPGHAA